MANGLIFIWTTKARITSIIDILGEKNYNYVENIVFSFFDPEKVKSIIQSIEVKKVTKKQNIEKLSKIKKDPDSRSFSTDNIAKFLHNTQFDLPQGQSVQDYLLSLKTEFIPTNKRTLLVFRRVS
jgi:hypothetical protein